MNDTLKERMRTYCATGNYHTCPICGKLFKPEPPYIANEMCTHSLGDLQDAAFTFRGMKLLGLL